MEKILQNSIPILFVLLLFAPLAKAQQVPHKAKSAFTQKFPNARQVEWGKESADEFEAEFSLNGVKMSANFDSGGNWKETEVTISHRELPDAVQQTLKRDYTDTNVKHIYKVTTPGQTLYEVAITNREEGKYEEDEKQEVNENEENEKGEYEEGKNAHELVFTADGKSVHKKEVEEDRN